jgi:hypothetical protein
MRVALFCVVAALGCGSGTHGMLPDAGVIDDPDAAVDAEVDAAGCQPKVLLAGGTDVAAQGWTTVMQAPATLSNGTDFVRLQTSTAVNGRTSGQLLLRYPAAFDVGQPFKLQVVMFVESVNPHNQLDSAAAIMGSFTPPFGAGNDRGEMIYLDSAAVGWADDTQRFAAPIVNGAYHTYELSVDAAGVAQLTVDGIAALRRTGFVFNGALAIGDQTNDPNVDSAIQIRSVTKLCL